MGILDDLSTNDPAPAAPASNPDVTGRSNLDAAKPVGILDSLEEADKANKNAQEPVPDWSSIPAKAAINAPHSAMEFGKNLAQPFLHPIKTAEGIGNLGLGVMEKLGLYGSSSHEKYADAVGQMLVDRYGSIDNVKKTLAHDPVGVLADISAVGTGGGSIMARAPGLIGKVGEAANTVGRIADPLNAVTVPLKAAGVIAREGLGLTTGVGATPIELAAKSGYEGGEAAKSFRDNMRGNVPLENVVEDAQGALKNLREERGTAYSNAMANAGLDRPIGVSGWAKIANAVVDADKIRKFKGVEIDPHTAAIRQQLRDTVNDWYNLDPKEYHTLEGIDALKKKIGFIRDGISIDDAPARKVANEYYSAVRASIFDKSPAYGKVMEGYEEASNQLRQIQKSFSLPENERKIVMDTALRKLQSVMRNNVNTNYGFRDKLMQNLIDAGAPNLRNAVAGQSMNTLAPRGLARVAAALGETVASSLWSLFGGSGTSIAKIVAMTALPIASPRIVGEVVHKAGQIARPLKYAPINKPLARAYQQVGRATTLPEMQARGGAVERALRATRSN